MVGPREPLFVILMSTYSVNARFYGLSLWPICGQNSQHSTDNEWQRMGTDVKTLEFLWWLQLLKWQILTFLPRPNSGP